LFWDCCEIVVRLFWNCFEIVVKFMLGQFHRPEKHFCDSRSAKNYFGAILWIKTPPNHAVRTTSGCRLNWIRTGVLVRRIYIIGISNSIFRRDLNRNYLRAGKENKVSEHYIKRFCPIQPKTWFRGNFAFQLSIVFSLVLYHIRAMLSFFSFLSSRNECK
jgi:hypothetical protein